MSDSAESRSIALDAMGGDLGPVEVVGGVREALASNTVFDRIYLVGKEDILEPLARDAGLLDDPRIVIFHASEVIGMDEKPVQALKQKRDASMTRAIELVKMGNCQAAVSCGNTGALMACGTLKLRTMPGVTKPAIATAIPTRTNHFILIDAGANPVAKADDLVNNAILGHHYARITLNCEAPRVGLLSIGTEEGKGNETTLEAHEHLKNIRDLVDYTGLVEGSLLFDNAVDVVVCDGFVGNILLKTCESLVGMFKQLLRDELGRSLPRRLGALISRGAFTDIRERTNKDRYGGAPLLGLNGTILKAHGSSNRHAITHAIRIAGEVAVHHLRQHAEGDIAEAQRRIRAAEDANPDSAGDEPTARPSA